MQTKKPLSHAGVKVPPPLIQLGFVGLGRALEFAVPLAQVPEAWLLPGRVLGVFVIAAGIGLILMAARKFRRAHTRLEPWKPTTVIVDSGLYGISRNPIYLSFQIVHLGIALVVPSAWIALTILPAVLTIRTYVIAREERYLASAFGEVYLAYQRRVRRWI